MPIAAVDKVSEIVLAALVDVQNRRYEQAARRVESLDDSVHLLGDPNDFLWLIWSAVHYSLYTLSSAMKRFDVPEDVVIKMQTALAEAETLFRQGIEQDDLPLVFRALEQITASAGEVSHAANFFQFNEKRENSDA